MASRQPADLIKRDKNKTGIKILIANLFMYHIYPHICNFKFRFLIEGKTCTVLFLNLAYFT